MNSKHYGTFAERFEEMVEKLIAEKVNAAFERGVDVGRSAERGICRICGKPEGPGFTYDYGREFAHTKCLEGK